MLIRTLFLTLFFGFLWIEPAKALITPVVLGDETVIIEQIQRGKGKAFFHVHQNETTALQAAKAVIAQDGGSVLTIHHHGARNVVFHLEGRRYEFDPNRIFTDVGIKKTLEQFGAYTPKAHQLVKHLATRILDLLPQGERIIAVHNNREYSLQEYFPGSKLAHEAKALHVADKSAIRNFYLVTQMQDYMKLKSAGFNGLLQAKDAEDDGSLSIYLAKSSYVNVEAAYGALNTQIRMLRTI